VKDWSSETVVCAASGPSLTKEDIDYVRGKAKLIVVNTTFRLAPWADVMYGADITFWRQYGPESLKHFQGERWSCTPRVEKEFGAKIIKVVPGSGFSPTPDTITSGGNSGYQAVHLAALWGAKRIVLLGYDMQRTEGKEHWHGLHEGGLRNGRNYEFWVRRFEPLARDLKKNGVDVINCTRKTALKCFRQAPLESIWEQSCLSA
jgi:hypothetical protein